MAVDYASSNPEFSYHFAVSMEWGSPLCTAGDLCAAGMYLYTWNGTRARMYQELRELIKRIRDNKKYEERLQEI